MPERDIPTVQPSSSAEPATTPHELSTEPAPPFCPPVAPAPVKKRDKVGPPPLFEPGQRVDDFEIQRLLGSGAFARVYLARQISLDRLVALKVSANQGTEARTLAHLEHDHIVQVFTETPAPAINLRYLCMQFVPGLTLERIILTLGPARPGGLEWPGVAGHSGHVVHRAGRFRPGRAQQSLDAAEPRPCRGGLLDGGETGPGPGPRPQPGRDSPRHQAGQHSCQSLWPALSGRLQHCPEFRPGLGPGRNLRRHAYATWLPSIWTPSIRRATCRPAPSMPARTSIRWAWCCSCS